VDGTAMIVAALRHTYSPNERRNMLDISGTVSWRRRLTVYVTNFGRPVFLVRVNLVSIGIRYKHLGYKASPFYTTLLTASGLAVPQQVLSARTRFQFPILSSLHPLQFGWPNHDNEGSSRWVCARA